MSGKINLEKLLNTRDLGGYQSLDGRSIIPHKLIRSDTLYDATKQDCKILKEQYDVKTIVDFRTSTERRQKPDPKLLSVQNIHLPILDEAVLGITHERDDDTDFMDQLLRKLTEKQGKAERYMQKLYLELVTNEQASQQYRQFLELLLYHQEGAVLWHCTAGKDRVGIGTLLVLSALEIPPKVMIEDYLMTSQYLQSELEQMIVLLGEKSVNAQMLDDVKSLFGVRESYITPVFAVMEEQFGSCSNYLSERLGFNHQKRELLKAKYLQ